MPTLQEMLLKDFGVETQVKTASVAGSEEIDALAARYGFDFAKTASDDKDEDDKGGDKDKEEGGEEGEKKASAGALGDYFNSLFPEDGDLCKTAEELEKAAAEEALGARAYDHFVARWDRRLDKIASEVLSGSATVSAPTGADHEGNVHKDLTIPQANKTNRPANAGEKIDTTPTITDEIHSGDGARQVGHLEQKHAAAESLAMRKAFILSQLER